MGRRKLKYREGDVFRVPVDGERPAVGVVARADGTGGLLAYFFAIEDLTAIDKLRPEGATLVARVGDLALMGSGSQRVGLGEVRWPVVGHLADFTRAGWPVPKLLRRIMNVLVSRDDDLNEIGTEQAGPGDGERYFSDAMYGWVAPEKYFAKPLRDRQVAAASSAA